MCPSHVIDSRHAGYQISVSYFSDKRLECGSDTDIATAFDITPTELPSVLVDELFFQAWADVLVASGWCTEEIRESNWILIQWKARPLQNRIDNVSNGDGRTEDRWYLHEESVPTEYRLELLEGKVSRFLVLRDFHLTVVCR